MEYLLCILLFLGIATIFTFLYNGIKKNIGVSDMDKMTILLQEYRELRDEVRQRITQRDSFAVQFIIAILTLLTISFSTKSYHILLLIPIITFFYSFLILSSYRMHEKLIRFIRENIEKQISNHIGCESADDFLWESFCEKDRMLTLQKSSGIRKYFFLYILIIMPILIEGMLYFLNMRNVIYIIYCFVFEILGIIIIYTEKRRLIYAGDNQLSFCDWQSKKPRTDEPQKAVFFDRDGTLHVDKVMTHKLKDLELLNGAKELVKKAHDKGYKIIIVTNQSAIGKGYYSVFRMHLFNWLLRKKLKYIDAIYYCPHTSDMNCNCKKPKTGMFERAKKDFNLTLTESIIVGDRMTDIIAGKNAGIQKRFFVTTGIYENNDYTKEPLFYEVEHKTISSLAEVIL